MKLVLPIMTHRVMSELDSVSTPLRMHVCVVRVYARARARKYVPCVCVYIYRKRERNTQT
jgi:hypothetical protein